MKIYVVFYEGPVGVCVQGPYTSMSEAIEEYFSLREEVIEFGGEISLIEHDSDCSPWRSDNLIRKVILPNVTNAN